MAPSDLILILLSIFGVSFIIASSKISFPLRMWIASRERSGPLLTFLECPACTSFWFGLVTGLWLNIGYVRSFALGGAASGCSLVLYLVTKVLDQLLKVFDELGARLVTYDPAKANELKSKE